MHYNVECAIFATSHSDSACLAQSACCLCKLQQCADWRTSFRERRENSQHQASTYVSPRYPLEFVYKLTNPLTFTMDGFHFGNHGYRDILSILKTTKNLAQVHKIGADADRIDFSPSKSINVSIQRREYDTSCPNHLDG